MRPEELAVLRVNVMDYMPDTAVVERLNPVLGVWNVVEQQPCRVVDRRTFTREGNGMLHGVTLWNVMLPFDTGVRTGDRIRVGGDVYPVTGVNSGVSERVLVIAQCGEA